MPNHPSNAPSSVVPEELILLHSERFSPAFWLVFDVLSTRMEFGATSKLTRDERNQIIGALVEMRRAYGMIDSTVWRYLAYRRYDYTMSLSSVERVLDSFRSQVDDTFLKLDQENEI